MSLLALSGTNSVSGGYDIDNSCKFEDDNDEYLYRTNASGTNRKTWTVSWWFKQTELPSTRSSYVEHWQGGVYGEATRAGIDSSDRLWIDIGGGDGNTGTLFRSLSTAKLRDTAAWYHVVIACDSTQSTEADRLKVWLNGVEATSWDQHQIPTLNFQSALQGTGGVVMKWGSYDATYHGYSGYLAECNYVDGVTATQNDFGEFDDDSGIWKPKEYTGSYGTNGSYLDFEIASDLGANAKGNDTNFSLNNITAADQATDTPTNNFCTWSPLWVYATNRTISEGGTKLTGSSAWGGCKGSIGVTNGKWYWEHKASGNDTIVGWQTDGDGNIASGNAHNVLDTIGLYQDGNYIWIKDSTSGRNDTSASGTNASGQIIGFALDLDSSPQTATFYRNGSAIASDVNIDGLTGKTLFPFIAQYNQNTEANFGGYTSFTISSAASDDNGYGTFEYAPPTSHFALCTKNLAEYG